MTRRYELRQVSNAVGGSGRTLAPWVIWFGFAIGVLIAAPVWGQAAPEVVRPRTDTPTLPPGAGNDRQLTQPRSESPLPGTQTARPIPDNGIITPPVPGPGSTTVIRPPATDGMAIIPPPGSPGGDRTVVPK